MIREILGVALSVWNKFEIPPRFWVLILMGYGKAARANAWRGACLGQITRHPLCEWARCATTTSHKTSPKPTWGRETRKRGAGP